MRADLDRRLSDLVRRFRHGMATALHHMNIEMRQLASKLNRERQTRQASAEDSDLRGLARHQEISISSAQRVPSASVTAPGVSLVNNSTKGNPAAIELPATRSAARVRANVGFTTSS